MARVVLIIAYHFPPLGGIASLRALRFARRLPEFGWDTLVLTPRHGDFTRDASLAFPAERTLRTGHVELSRAARGALRLAPGQAGRLPRRSLLARVRDAARRWLYRPDAQIGWYPFALSAARELLRERRVDALFSTAYPLTAHVIARRLCRDARIPWVADFRDLWTDWSTETGLRRALDQRLERAVLTSAAAVTSVSPTYAELLATRGARRTLALTNSFDVESFTDAPSLLPPLPREHEAVVVHLGTYYAGFHDLASALLALGTLRRGGRRLRLLFVGALPDALRPTLAAAGLDACTQATGVVSQTQALRHVAAADLLLLGAPLESLRPAPRGWIPAKTFEYLGARRRLLVVGDAGTDVARLARRFARVRVVPAGDEAAAAAAIDDLCQRTLPVEDAASLEPFTSRATTAALAELLDSLC